MNHGLLGLGRWSILINNGKWVPRNFDIIIIELLQYALQGRVSKILLSVPRRHGKSTLISRNFLSYFLSHFPNEKVILTSYTQKLASKFGGECRNIIKNYGHLSPYNIELSGDSKAKNQFNIQLPGPRGRKENAGEMLAMGSNGSILGFGAGCFIIDDAIKSYKEARSDTVQFNLREWYTSTARTSLEHRTDGLPPIMVVIGQRLNVRDLHGIIKEDEPYIDASEALTILRKGGSIPFNTWVDVNFPALCVDPETDLLNRELNQPLWPEQRDYDWLMAEKNVQGELQFNAMYQGDPKEAEGKYFPLEELEELDFYPNNISQEIQWADLASTYYPPSIPIHKRGAATAIVRLALTHDNKLIVTYFDELWEEEDTVTNIILETAKTSGKKIKYCIPQDPGQAAKGQVKKYSLLMPGYNFEGIIESGDKEYRADAPNNWCKLNKIYIFKDSPGPNITGLLGSKEEAVKRFKKVISEFPNNRHKDYVDAISGAFSELEILYEDMDEIVPGFG